MATTENINAMISSYERIEGEYSFKNFLQSANIKEGTYACIGELLKRVKDAITVKLIEKEIKTLNHIWETYLETEGASPICETMKVSELETVFGDLWRKKPAKEGFGDNKEPTPFWKSDKEIAEFWNDNNRKQVETYHDISDYLNKETRLSFNKEDIIIINDDDIKESIYGFFKLVDEIGDSTVRKQLVDFVCSFRSIISAKGLIQSKSIEPLVNDEVVLRQIARFFVLKAKNDFFKGNHAIEKRKDKNGNSIHFSYEEIRTLSQQDNTKYADIINKIINVLLKENGKPVYYWTNLTKFLNILRFLRNGKAHYLQEVVEEGEQLPVACFILHTYVGTYLTIKKNLQNLDELSEPLDYEELGVKTLTVYFNGDLKEDVSGNEYIENVLRPKLYSQEEVIPLKVADGYSEYRIEREEAYILRFGEGEHAVEDRVPSDMFWNSVSTNPVAFWDGVEFHFCPDVSTMSSELNPLVQTAQKKDLEKIVNLLGQVESHLKGIEKGTDELKSIRETLALGQKRLEDLGDKIDRGFEQAHTDAEEHKNISKDTNRYLKILVGIVSAVIIGVSIYLFAKERPKEKPEVLIEKGDNYLREGNPEKAGEKYREAIVRYQEILSNDSANFEANIGLAVLLMRGKGEYNPTIAEKLVSNIRKSSSRAEGLYLYLLIRNGKSDKAADIIDAMDYALDIEGADDYVKMSDALVTIYGAGGRERKLEAIIDASKTIGGIQNEEAVLESALMTLHGICKDNANDAYWINPDPLYGLSLLDALGQDSLNAYAMALAGDYFLKLGDVSNSLDKTYAAWKCGVEDCIPLLRLRMMLFVDLLDSDDKIKKIWDEAARHSRQQESIGAEISNFMQKLTKYEKGKLSAKSIIQDLNVLISHIEESSSEDYKFLLDGLYRERITLNLEDGDIRSATSLVMPLEEYYDSLAVADYLRGVCYHRGCGGFPSDSVLRDSLIYVSAERGFPQAIYTRLKKNKPMEEIIGLVDDASDSPIIYYKTACPTKQPPLFREAEPLVTYFDDLPNDVQRKIDAQKKDKVSMYRYLVPSDAEVADSIWKKIPKLAMELSEYWLPYYKRYKKLPPYLDYCQMEYKYMYEVREMAFEFSNEKGLFIIKEGLPEEFLHECLLKLQAGISSALQHGDVQMAKILITMWPILANHTDATPESIKYYEYFALPEYKEGTFKFYEPIGTPIYAY